MQEEVVKTDDIELVTLNIVKKHLRVESDCTDDDDLIDTYISSAIEQIENFTERPLKEQTTIYSTNAFHDFVYERKAVNDVIEKVEYKQVPEGESSVLPASAFSVTKQGTETFKVAFKNTPEAVEVKIYIKQGYTGETLPKVIKQAIFLLVTEAYDRRDNNAAVINTKAKSLIQSYRKWQV